MLCGWLLAACGMAPVRSSPDSPIADEIQIPTPPAEHPRLYLRSAQAAGLATRFQDPVLQPAVESLRASAKRSRQFQVEWDALQCLARPDRERERATIQAALSLLQQCQLQDIQDACRVTGRMMVTGAIVYDWLYEGITPAERQAFVKELVRLAMTQECGYPPTRQGSVTGHASEAMIMRDMLSAGIAIHDEFPEMYRLAAGRFFREHLPARNWLYQGHAYHQGDSYGLHRYSWDTYPLFIFDRMGAGAVYSPEQRFVPYSWVYATRPDGQRLRAGDTFAHGTPLGQPWSEYMGTLLTASYYRDGVLLSQYLRQGSVGASEAIFEFLWRDTALKPVPVDSLPLSRYFGTPFGWMIARTGWGPEAAIAEMKINEYNFANHQHMDAGAFQLYHRGALAVDSGLYSGSSGQYGSPHCLNYYWRTIAHNALLVYDPAEKFGGKYGNDGGQRLPGGRHEPRTLRDLLAPERGYRTGRVLAQGFGPDAQIPDFTLLQGDLTAAYSEKVRQVARSFVFLNLHDASVPAALLVLDRVVSSDPAFRKHWLLHTLEEPRVEGASAFVDRSEHGSQGRLRLDVLLPEAGNASLEKIGGPGREFWAFGTNHANAPDPERVKRGSMELGAWRLELSPKAPAEEDLFLTVMQLSDRQTSMRRPVRRVDLGERTGCRIEGPEAGWWVLLRRDATRSRQSLSVEVAGRGPQHILITDLEAGAWTAAREGSNDTRVIVVSEATGAAWFTGPAGSWTLRRSP